MHYSKVLERLLWSAMEKRVMREPQSGKECMQFPRGLNKKPSIGSYYEQKELLDMRNNSGCARGTSICGGVNGQILRAMSLLSCRTLEGSAAVRWITEVYIRVETGNRLGNAVVTGDDR